MVSAHYTCLHFPYDTEDVRVNVKSKLDRCGCCTFHTYASFSKNLFFKCDFYNLSRLMTRQKITKITEITEITKIT